MRNTHEVQQIVQAAKDLLRNKGLRYPDVARALNVSERTVQRWLGKGPVTLEVLADLCEFIGIPMAELLELATRPNDGRLRRLSVEQEQALVDTPMLAFLFTRLLQGWSTEDLKRACGLDEAGLVKHLIAFERLGLIELHPRNRVRLLTRRDIAWRPGGPMRSYFDTFARDLIAVTKFGDEASIWTFEAFHVTDTAAAGINARLQSLRLEVRALAERERNVPAEQKHWYSLLLLAHRHDLADPADPLTATFAIRDFA